MPFAESNFESALMELFRDSLHYDTLYGPDILRDQHVVVLEDKFTTSFAT